MSSKACRGARDGDWELDGQEKRKRIRKELQVLGAEDLQPGASPLGRKKKDKKKVGVRCKADARVKNEKSAAKSLI